MRVAVLLVGAVAWAAYAGWLLTYNLNGPYLYDSLTSGGPPIVPEASSNCIPERAIPPLAHVSVSVPHGSIDQVDATGKLVHFGKRAAAPDWGARAWVVDRSGNRLTKEQLLVEPETAIEQPGLISAPLGYRVCISYGYSLLRTHINDPIHVRVEDKRQAFSLSSYAAAFGPPLLVGVVLAASRIFRGRQSGSSRRSVNTKLVEIGSGNAAPRADVIFVHGLDGDCLRSWGLDDDQASAWRGLREDRPDLRISSLSYSASSTAWFGSAMPLMDRAVNVLSELVGRGYGDRPIYWIVHSMGGLLVKAILRHADTSEEYGSIAKATRGIAFYSTPHSGADLAKWVSRLSDALRTTAAVRDLHPHGQVLRELNVWYRNNAARLHVTTLVFYESLPTYGVLVVEAGDADPGIANATPVPVDANHFDVCKPLTSDDSRYARVLQKLDQLFPRTDKDSPPQSQVDSHDRPPSHAGPDRALFQEFLSSLPFEPTMRMVREQDFGAPFERLAVDPLFEFIHTWDSPEKFFLDAEWQAAFHQLYVELRKLADLITERTVPIGETQNYASVFSDQQRAAGARPQHVLDDARALNQQAAVVWPRYEDFVRTGRMHFEV